MYFHVMLGSNDIARSTRFYDAVLGALGIANGGPFRPDSMLYGNPATGLFLLTKPLNGEAACNANGGTVMFKANTRADVDAFYNAGIANGGSDCEGKPKEGGLPNSYMGYLRDPDNNKIAVVAFG